MRIQKSPLSVLAAAAFVAATGLAACDQSPSSRNTAEVMPPRTTEPSTTESRKTTSSAMDSQPTDRIAAITDDAAVTTKVKAALMAEPGLRSLEIHVDTKNGVVTLTGTPDSAANRDRAVVVARNVAGVRDVIDQMASKAQS